jgi:hypothetical protein
MGNRHRGYFTKGTKMIQILIHHNQHIHQVDGSYASGEHNAGSSGQVLAGHHIQIRRAPKSLGKQWNSVQRSEVCKMLRGFWYPPSSIINSTSSDERASRASKWTYSTKDEYKNVP